MAYVWQTETKKVEDKYKDQIGKISERDDVDMGVALIKLIQENSEIGKEYKEATTADRNARNAGLPSGGAVSGSSKGSSDSASAVNDIKNAYLAREKAMQEGLTHQLGELKVSSDSNRSQAYTNARVSAIGNNEAMATQGLAGGLYEDSTSGKSESSRIQQDVALGNAINAINRQQTALEGEMKMLVSQGIADNQLEMAKSIAQLQMQQEALDREEARYQEQLKLAKETQEKQDFINTIGAYHQDYAKKINELKNDGDPSNDWQIPYLEQARGQKLADQESAKAQAEKESFDRWLAIENLNIKKYNATKSGGGGTTKVNGFTKSEALKAYESGIRTDTVMSALYQFYGGDFAGTSSDTDNAKSKLTSSDVGKLVSKDDFGEIDYIGTAQEIYRQYTKGNLTKADAEKYINYHTPYTADLSSGFFVAEAKPIYQELQRYQSAYGIKEAMQRMINSGVDEFLVELAYGKLK